MTLDFQVSLSDTLAGLETNKRKIDLYGIAPHMFVKFGRGKKHALQENVMSVAHQFKLHTNKSG